MGVFTEKGEGEFSCGRDDEDEKAGFGLDTNDGNDVDVGNENAAAEDVLGFEEGKEKDEGNNEVDVAIFADVLEEGKEAVSIVVADVHPPGPLRTKPLQTAKKLPGAQRCRWEAWFYVG